MKLVVGLGNPGDKYKNNRHNIGFIILDQFVQTNDFGKFSYDNKYASELLEAVVSGEKVLFLKPMLYMNKSGEAVQKIMNFYKIKADELLVIHDEIDLVTGKIQFKEGGGLAGHNGLKGIAEKIGTKDFNRIRIGVDRPALIEQVSNYVLTNFKKEEVEKIQDQYLLIENMLFEFLK